MAESVFEHSQAHGEEPGKRDHAAIDEVSSQHPQTAAAVTGASHGFGSAIPAAPIDPARPLTPRSPDNVATVAREISAAGAAVETAGADALDEKSVTEHLGAVVADPAEIDLCAYELTGYGFHARA